MPAFRVQAKVVAGFAAFKNHLSYLPHSASVFPEMGDAISRYMTSRGALQFAVDKSSPCETAHCDKKEASTRPLGPAQQRQKE